MKKRYNFTLDEDLMDWFKSYAKKNRTKCSAILNQHLYKLYTEGNKKPKNVNAIPFFVMKMLPAILYSSL